MNTAQAIRKARLARGYSQEKLAELLGVTQGSIAHYEQGRRVPSIAMLEKVAVVCQFSLLEVMSFGDETIEQSQEVTA